MEVGWYLRFSREGKLTVLADLKTEKQVEHQLHILPEWTVETFQEEGHMRFEFLRPPSAG